MWINKLVFSLSLTLAVAACGGDDDGSDVETQTNPAQATSTVTQMGAFNQAFATAAGADAAFAAYSMGSSAGNIVAPVPQGQARRVQAPFNAVGSCECTESGCVFDGCGDESGTWVINGSISKSGDTYTFDYSMDLNSTGYMWTWSTEGEMTISATLIDGSMSSEGEGTFDDGQGNSLEQSWGWDVTASEIGLDETGCAVSGSMDASVSYTGSNGQGGSASYSGSGTVTFGPACGQAQ